MKLTSVAFAALVALAACADDGMRPAVQPSTQANAPPGPNTTDTTIVTSSTTAGSQSQQATAAAAGNQGQAAVPNAGARESAGESASPPRTPNEAHGLAPKQGAPRPVNTGDPCGACNTPPAERH